MYFLRNKKIIQISVVLAAVGLFILFGQSRVVLALRAIPITIFSPVLSATLRVRASWNVLVGRDESATGEDGGRLQASLVLTEELSAENERLREALEFKKREEKKLVGADILMYGKELGREFLLINKGTSDGIVNGGIAYDANGLVVGVVKEAAQEFAKISIISNPDEVQEVQILPLHGRAFARGIGNRTFALELVSIDMVVRQGDMVVASFPGRTYARPIAEVVSVGISQAGGLQEVRALLLAKPEMLKQLFIPLQ